MKLILVRHGETEENRKSVMQGHKYGTLSEKGEKQAKKVGERLKGEKIDKIYSSDLERTSDTVKEIAKHHDVPLEFTDKLRERKAGDLAGSPVQELLDDREQKGLEEHEYTPENGENYRDVLERTSEFLDDIIENHKDENVLLVSHGTAIKIMLTYLLDKDISEAIDFSQHNTCVNVLEITDSEVNDIAINDTKHLEDN